MLFDFGKALIVNNGSLLNAISHAIANLQCVCRFGKPFSKGVIDSVLNENAVRTDACLAGIAEF